MARDKDYRGVKTTVDWSKLVYAVRRQRPGALEVLQDAINEWFPQQFQRAKEEAIRRSQSDKIYGANRRFYVGFSAQKAKHRFSASATTIRGELLSPFVIRDSRIVAAEKNSMGQSYTGNYSSMHKAIAYVYSARGSHKNPRKLERTRLKPTFTGGLRVAKLPVIYFVEMGDQDDEDNAYEQTLLIVKGIGVGKWAENAPEISGEQWQVDRSGDSATMQLDGHEDIVKVLRRHGYKNKIKYLEYMPDRSFLEPRRRRGE